MLRRPNGRNLPRHLERIDRQRDPQVVRPFGIRKVRAHHADDLVRHARQADAAADDRRIGAEAAPPERLAEQHDALVADLVFFFGEAPAEHGDTPSTGSGFAEMRAASSRSGSPLPSGEVEVGERVR